MQQLFQTSLRVFRRSRPNNFVISDNATNFQWAAMALTWYTTSVVSDPMTNLYPRQLSTTKQTKSTNRRVSYNTKWCIRILVLLIFLIFSLRGGVFIYVLVFALWVWNLIKFVFIYVCRYIYLIVSIFIIDIYIP